MLKRIFVFSMIFSLITTFTAAGSDTPFVFSAVTVIVPVYASEGSPLIVSVHPVNVFVSPAGIMSGLVVHVTGVSLSAVIVRGVIAPAPACPLRTDEKGTSSGFIPDTSQIKRTFMQNGRLSPSRMLSLTEVMRISLLHLKGCTPLH